MYFQFKYVLLYFYYFQHTISCQIQCLFQFIIYTHQLERIFSSGGQIVTVRRNELSDITFHKLLLLSITSVIKLLNILTNARKPMTLIILYSNTVTVVDLGKPRHVCSID